MAKTGCRYMTVCPITSYADGAAPTYTAASKTQLTYLTSIDVTNEYSDAELYGDDMCRESDKGMTGYSVSANLTDLTPAMGALLMGWEKTGTGETEHYIITDANSPEVGFGFIACGMVNGVKYYDAFWYYRARFTKDSNNAATKEKQTSFNGDAISATGYPVALDTTGKYSFCDMKRCTTEAAAKTFIDGHVS